MSDKGLLQHDTLAQMFPDGVAAREALVALGLTHSYISRQCREDGPWRRPIPGVIIFSNRRPTLRQQARIALAHAGPDAMITGVQAARLHGVRNLPPEPRLHALITHRRKVASWGWAIVERTIHLPEAVEVGGLPVAPLARALIDAARRMDHLPSVRAMITDAVERGLCDVEDLRLEIAQASTIGSALPRVVIREISAGTRAAAEHWVAAVVQESRLPAPEWEVELEDQSGALLGQVYAWWPSVGMAVQVAFEEMEVEPGKADSPAELTADDLVIVKLRPTRLRDHPEAAIQELRAGYERAAQRPPPAIRARPRHSAA